MFATTPFTTVPDSQPLMSDTLAHNELPGNHLVCFLFSISGRHSIALLGILSSSK